MKRFLLYSTSLLIFLVSCERRIDTTENENNDVSSLTVNPEFDWESTHQVTFNVLSEMPKVIKIQSEDMRTIYHKGYHNALTETYSINLRLPKYVKTIRINGRLVPVDSRIINHNLLKSKTAEAKIYKSEAVALWNFDETSGDVALDEQGSNNGTVYEAERVNGRFGRALKFDGEDDEVVVQPSNNLAINGNEITLTTWFKLDEVGNDGVLLFQNTKYILKIDKHGKLSFALYSPGYEVVIINWNDRIIDTDWHHFAGTYDGNSLKLYLDGELMNSEPNSGNIKHSDSDIYIGSQKNTNHFKGLLDLTGIYDITLSDQEIQSLFATDPNPGTSDQQAISVWKLDENSGTTTSDEVSNNSGVLEGGVNWTSGMSGAGLLFDGEDDNVRIENAENLNPAEQVTLMGWARPEAHKESKIAQKGDWDGHNIGLGKWTGWKGSIRLASNESITLEWDNGRVQLGQWYHVAITYDGSMVRFFVNGQLEAAREVSGPLNVNGRDFNIGSDNRAQKFFKGAIDDVRYFGSALSQSEIQSIIEGDENTEITDDDGDGIANEEDDFPDDPGRAFLNNAPAEGFGGLAFEDLWPGKGDYDFNDLVLDYRFRIVTNSQNYVSDMEGIFVVKAIGAGMQNGFGFQLNNVSLETNITSVDGNDLREGYITLSNNGLEANQNLPTVIVFDNAHNIMPPPTGFGVNVEPNKPYLQPDTVTVNITFTANTMTIGDLKIEQFNPFMIVNGERGREVHLANYAPSNLADKTMLGSMDDNSDESVERYYKTENNLPWAIRIPEPFDYPVEKIMVTEAHLKFKDWAESSGTQYNDWFKNNSGYRNTDNIYQHEDSQH